MACQYGEWTIANNQWRHSPAAMSCIVPTAGWGYQWGRGPLSDGALFEIPYRLWIHTGDGAELAETLPYFKRYLSYLKSREEADGQVTFGLGDWATAGGWQDVPVPFVNDVLIHKFERITAAAAELAGKAGDRDRHLANAEDRKRQILARWLGPDGRAVIPQMTLPAVLLVHGIWTDRKALEEQLVELVEANECRHRCGLLGLRCRYEALALCGREDLAYRVITANGYPSYRQWFTAGATTLWEHWKQNRPNGDYASKNHHMYSDVLSYLVKSTLGIRHDRRTPEEPEFCLEPYLDIERIWQLRAELHSLTVLMIRNCADNILLSVADSLRERDEQNNSYGSGVNDISRYLIAVQFVQDNLYRPIRSADVAKSVYMSTKQLNRIFAREMGMSISDYISEQKCYEAKRLLAEGTEPIHVISARLGFGDQFYFNKFFKKHVGLPPHRYRKANAEKK